MQHVRDAIVYSDASVEFVGGISSVYVRDVFVPVGHSHKGFYMESCVAGYCSSVGKY